MQKGVNRIRGYGTILAMCPPCTREMWLPRDYAKTSQPSSPPPSTPIEPGGTYTRSPSPEPPPPPISGKGYTPYLGYRLPIGNYKKTLFSAFSVNFPETEAKRYTPFPRKWERACGPLCIWSGGGGGSPLVVKVSRSSSSEVFSITSRVKFTSRPEVGGHRRKLRTLKNKTDTTSLPSIIVV